VEEDRRILERGEMLARLPSFSPARTAVSQRQSVSGEVAAQFEASGDIAPSSA
jgi:hypothetical protein